MPGMKPIHIPASTERSMLNLFFKKVAARMMGNPVFSGILGCPGRLRV